MKPFESLPHTAGSEPSVSAEEVESILRERGWLTGEAREADPAMRAWLERAAMLLGRHAADCASLGDLLGLVFQYDARDILGRVGSHEVMARAGARDVVRELARELLADGDLDSDRLKRIASALQERTGLHSRAMFHPLRLALAGRPGGGELDRVVLLIDGAARLRFAVPVKSARERMLEFCAALD